MWADPPEDPPEPGNSWLPLVGAVALAIVMLWLVSGPIPALVAAAVVLAVAFLIATRRRRRRAKP